MGDSNCLCLFLRASTFGLRVFCSIETLLVVIIKGSPSCACLETPGVSPNLNPCMNLAAFLLKRLSPLARWNTLLLMISEASFIFSVFYSSYILLMIFFRAPGLPFCDLGCSMIGFSVALITDEAKSIPVEVITLDFNFELNTLCPWTLCSSKLLRFEDFFSERRSSRWKRRCS